MTASKSDKKGNTLHKNRALPLLIVTKPLYLLMNAFVLIIVLVIWASASIKTEEITHLVFIKAEGAGVVIYALIIDVVFATVAA